VKYRADIDGVRAIAVLSVLFFHFGFYGLSGGYIGVDVFFVISGYLITSIILTDLDKDTFSFKKFYEKRMRRLFPALFAMIFVSFLAGYYIFMPEEFSAFAQSAVATAIYVSNFFFWMKSDYFSGPSELKPLLHTWSLAVEEQFYFVFPLFLVFAYKWFKKYLLHLLVVLIICSFLGGLFTIFYSASSAFYLSPIRFWELLVGSLLAYLTHNEILKQARYPKIGSVLGLLLIVVSLLLLDKTSLFPGGWALLPVIGTTLLIYSGPNSGLVSVILQSRPFVYIGKISYSLYLWHWPVVVFYGYWLMDSFEIKDQLIMIVVTVLLSLASYYVFEKPFRKTKGQSHFYKALSSTIMVSVGIIALGLFVSMNKGLPERFGQAIQLQEKYSDEKEKNRSCFLKSSENFTAFTPELCRIKTNENNKNNKNNKNIVLWGDSHANHLYHGFSQYIPSSSYNFLYFANAGCPPILDVSVKNRPNCQRNNHSFYEYIQKEKVDTMILAASWFFAQSQSGVELSKLVSTVQKLRDANINVIVINQLPIYSISNPSYLLARLTERDALNKDYAIAPARGLTVLNEVTIAAKDAQLVNLHEAFCSDDGKCTLYKGGQLMVVDHAHLSKAGSEVAVEFIFAQIDQK
jgi:peptidoglycan/LPS O-acetylase OafA/YrhL